MRLALLAATMLTATPALAAEPATLYADLDGVQATADGRLVRFTAMLVDEDGRIVATYGPGDTLPSADVRLDMDGAHVLPGLIDGHGHVMGLGQAMLNLDMVGTSSIAEFQKRIADYAAAHPDLPAIIGRGWNHELFAEGRYPTAADIDAVVADRPVYLSRVDGHAAVANSAAMALAGITAASKAPEGGSIERLADGAPAGVFIDNAQSLFDGVGDGVDAASLDRALAASQGFMLSQGLTAAADMGTTVTEWHAMRRMGDAGALKVRIMSYGSGAKTAADIAGTGPTPWLYDGRLRMAGIKLYADGALGSRGAMLKKEYSDEKGHFGLPVMSEDELRENATWAATHDIQVAIHAIGDAANEEVISIFEDLKTAYPTAVSPRHRIEHFQIVDPVDLPRIANADIIASMQPVHETSDWKMAEKRLGKDRLGGAYAWNSVLKSGAHLAFGTDFPVEHPNPFVGLEVAVTRMDPNGEPAGGWLPQERITLGQALAAYTVGAAYAGKAEEAMGGLAPGRYADFIIVDRDITKVKPTDISETKVLATYVGGEKVYSAD